VLIALTGGIGSGKSTVAQRWVELGATEIDADILAREVVRKGSIGLKAIEQRFGWEVIDLDGNLDRKALARRAFATERDRKDLEAILHPLIQELAQSKIAEISGDVVYTIPLFVETNSPLRFDHVVAISCDEQVRIDRLVANRGFSEADARARIASQATDTEREAAADVVIDSNCSMDELLRRADKAWIALKG
jgi:dephospho-CoA kinase